MRRVIYFEVPIEKIVKNLRKSIAILTNTIRYKLIARVDNEYRMCMSKLLF